jgi:hypothetical protein
VPEKIVVVLTAAREFLASLERAGNFSTIRSTSRSARNVSPSSRHHAAR